MNLDLESILTTLYGVQETDPCNHSTNTPLRSGSEHSVTTTSVASPYTSIMKTAIAQTQHNPVARLLCCEFDMLAMLLKDCCLDCALNQLSQRRSLQRSASQKRIMIV